MRNIKNKTVIVDLDCYTACGLGVEPLWNHLINSKTAISQNNRFNTNNLISNYSALCEDIKIQDSSTYLEQMIYRLSKNKNRSVQKPDLLLLGTTVGEIDYLENAVTDKKSELKEQSKPKYLLDKCCRIFNAQKGMHISAACASSTIGVIQAHYLSEKGEIETAIVIGCDAVSEFVMSGFSALLALSKNPAKPFGADRDGLTIGEGAAYISLVSEKYAKEHGLKIIGYVSGGGISNDSNHITGPSRDGSGLAKAINSAFSKSDLNKDEIDSISAHGTATPFNDSMEMKAFKKVFHTPIPTYSIKGCIGHTMGASGIIEVITALKSIEEGVFPPTIGTSEIDEEALQWVYLSPIRKELQTCLSVNSGFGGINAAVLLKKS